MNKKRAQWLIVGMYLCIIATMITVFWLTNQQRKFILDLRELNSGLRMINWFSLALVGGLAFLAREIFPWNKIAEETPKDEQEAIETSLGGLGVKSEILTTNLVVKEPQETEKKEILTIYLASGDSFSHEIDETKLSSQDIIDAWRHMPLGGELNVEDSDGWSMYKMDQIAAITILLE